MNKATSTPLDSFRRHLIIYGALWKNSLVREMGFKVNFILWIFVEMLWFALQLSFFAVIYAHTDSIAGWSKWEVVLLVGASHFVQQLFTAVFLTNVTELSELIRTGKLDFMLLLPVNTRFLVSFRKVDLGGFVNAASALGVMVFACNRLGLTPSPMHIVGFFVLTLASLVIHYTLVLILASTAFWTVRSQGIVWIYYNLFNVARIPDGAFSGFYRVVFTFILPMVLVANVPVKLLLQKLSSPGEMLLLIGLAASWFVISEAVWRYSLRRYTSASS